MVLPHKPLSGGYMVYHILTLAEVRRENDIHV